MHRVLKVLSGPIKGQSLIVSDQFATLIGRGKHANAQIADNSISRVHCEVEIRGKRTFLSDLESVSGTFVNGKRVSDCELREGDLIKIGDTQMRLESPDSSDEATLAPALAIPVRPVLLTAEKLPELSGHVLSHYTVGKLLAKAQSGLVFQAHDFKNDRNVALKVLFPDFSQNEDDLQRFIRAMKTMMPLRHPNLVTLFGAGKTGPYCWIAMELVEGEGLTQIIRRMGTANMLPPKSALMIVQHLAKALEYAHGKNIIHRNITPQNVLIGKSPADTKLGDLMFAKAQEGVHAQDITKPGELVGDLKYMSPERTIGSTEVDARSDLYSLGALLYCLLTGRPPFEGTNVIDTILKIRQAEPVRPKKFQLAVSDALEGLVLKLLAKRPDDRYASATQLLKEIDRISKFQP